MSVGTTGEAGVVLGSGDDGGRQERLIKDECDASDSTLLSRVAFRCRNGALTAQIWLARLPSLGLTLSVRLSPLETP